MPVRCAFVAFECTRESQGGWVSMHVKVPKFCKIVPCAHCKLKVGHTGGGGVPGGLGALGPAVLLLASAGLDRNCAAMFCNIIEPKFRTEYHVSAF